jgi:dissimilatory sulfite reductase (desulfoviridin) alpha/beta subunit
MNPKVSQKPPAVPLIKHMKDAANSDINPWVRGYSGEVFSKLSVKHPLIDRQISLELDLLSQGWLSADGLYLASEIAESRGAELVELSGPEKSLRLLGISPEGREIPWNALRKTGLGPKISPAKPDCCPFWGPCLGRKNYLSEALEELTAEIEPEIIDDFRIELAGCTQDCRQAASRADLALIFDSIALSFVIWLGGRHRPFRESILPYSWLKEDLNDVKRLLEVIFKVHDLWRDLAIPPETLPELVQRIGLDSFERHLTPGHKPRKAGRPPEALGKD